MAVFTIVFGVIFCYLLFGPFIREARRACKAIEAKERKKDQE